MEVMASHLRILRAVEGLGGVATQRQVCERLGVRSIPGVMIGCVNGGWLTRALGERPPGRGSPSYTYQLTVTGQSMLEGEQDDQHAATSLTSTP
jgi:hypothetical protein